LWGAWAHGLEASALDVRAVLDCDLRRWSWLAGVRTWLVSDRRAVNSTGLVRLVGWVAAVFFVVFGIWAFAAPANFFEHVALFPPYNRHLLHDAGAFQLGIAASLLLGLLGWSGLGTAVGGAAVGSVLHAVSHVADNDLGGRASDPFSLGVLAAALIVATWLSRPTRTKAPLR
jgi:hypothetical protein